MRTLEETGPTTATDFSSEMWQECQRLAVRTRASVDLWILQRQSRKAERLLGELGWQQADYAENDSEAKALQTAEQREARLLFDTGEISEQMSVLSTGLTDENARVQKEIAVNEDIAVSAETRAMASLKSLQVEKALGSPDFVLQRIEKTLAADEAALLGIRETIRLQTEALGNFQENTAAQLAQLQVSLKRLQDERAELQEKKNHHYLSIGRELADVGIAPLNQPEALTQVLRLREKTETLQALRQRSFALSEPLPWSIRVAARLLAGFFLLALLLCSLLVLAIFWSALRH